MQQLPPKTIVVDFDKTICNSNYPDVGHINKGAKEALTLFKSLGYNIIISSCRTSGWYLDHFDYRVGYQVMVDCLKQHEIPFDYIDEGDKGKPFANYYVDDKAIPYKGCWEEVVSFVLANEPKEDNQLCFDFVGE